jgi:hypothetical protein
MDRGRLVVVSAFGVIVLAIALITRASGPESDPAKPASEPVNPGLLSPTPKTPRRVRASPSVDPLLAEPSPSPRVGPPEPTPLSEELRAEERALRRFP